MDLIVTRQREIDLTVDLLLGNVGLQSNNRVPLFLVPKEAT